MSLLASRKEFFYYFLLLPVTFAFLSGHINVMTREDFLIHILPLRDKLFRIAWHITRSREEAEDIVQDVMLKVWNREDQKQQIENIQAYCYTMARNFALKRLELKVNKSEELKEIENVKEEKPDSVLEQGERLGLLYQLIENLPSPQRDIVQLRDVEGLSYKEIANTLQLSEEQVKINLFRTRKKIRELYLNLENYGLHIN